MTEQEQYINSFFSFFTTYLMLFLFYICMYFVIFVRLILKIFTLWKFGICFFFLHFKNKLNFTLVKKGKTPYKACEEWLDSLILYFMKSCKKIIYIIMRNKISAWTRSFYLLDCHPKCVSNPMDLKFLCALGLLERLVKTQTPLPPPRFFWFRRSVMRSRNIFISNEFPGANAAGCRDHILRTTSFTYCLLSKDCNSG